MGPIDNFALKGLDCISQCFGLPVQEAIVKRVDSFVNLENNWSSLKDERDNLRAVEADLHTEVSLEEHKLKDPSCHVKHWREKVADFSKKATTQAEYDTLARCLCNCTPNLWHRLQLGKRVREDLDGVSKLLTEKGNIFPLAYPRLPDIAEERRRAQPFGMDLLLLQLRAYFNDKNRTIIGVHGLGGVGKTTLLSEFNNELMNRSEYQVVIFIEVSNSDVLNVADIQRKIAHRLCLPWNETESEEFRAERLLQVLIRKKFVILLDDVRKEFELQKVGIPKPTESDNCKVIIASRSEEVCIQMEAQKSMIEVKCWQPSAAWGLFLHNLSDEATLAIEDDPDIKSYARAIIHRCGGLPLALSVIGRAVASYTKRDEWKAAADALSATPEHLIGMEDLFCRLKYSYDQLKSSVQRDCFLYCALFPEYGSIKKEQLIDYWIGEGLIHESHRGHYIIRVLVSASLLERGDEESTEVKMHDIIRQLALWLASDCENRPESLFLVQAGRGLKVAPKVRMWEGATRISLIFNDIDSLPQSPNCAKLSTLLLQNNPNLHNIHPAFFKNMPCLMVLDLSHTAIEEFPIGADVLAQLQHLNLCCTRITKLPKELAILKELKYLDLSETSALEEIPDGTISVLINLRVLNIYKSHYGVREVQDLNLERLENLDFLGITIHSDQVLEKLKRTDRLAQSTHCLSLQYCEGMKFIRLSIFQHMARLEVLFVHDCSKLKKLILDDIGTESRLQALTLSSLPNLVTIKGPEPHHLFHNLRSLTIESCPQLECVTWILQLSSLEKLAISFCEAMERVVEEVTINDDIAVASTSAISEGDGEKDRSKGGEIQVEVAIEVKKGTEENIGERTEARHRTTEAFGRLKSIILKDLQQLESICQRRCFPCLEIISVENCPNLKMLPLACNYQNLRLKQIRGSQDWWNKLVWEEENLVSILSGHFVPI